MRVVCEACSAKYQIADDRLSGRRIRIRCRKCGSSIAVKGGPSERKSRASSAPLPESDGLSWYISVTGDERGPYETADVVSQISTGAIDWQAYVWRDGYADWKTIGDSETLVHAVAARDASGYDRASIGELADLPSNDDEPTRLSSEAETQRLSIASAPAPKRTDMETDLEQATGTDDAPTRRFIVADVQPSEELQPFARNASAARTGSPVGRSYATSSVGSGSVLAAASSAPASVARNLAVVSTFATTQAAASNGARSIASDLRQRLSAARAPSGSLQAGAEDLNTLDALEPVAPPQLAPVKRILPPRVRANDSPIEKPAPVRESSPLSLSVSAPAGRVSAPSHPGLAVGDGSGLIDIRQLVTLSKSNVAGMPSVSPAARAEVDHDALAGFGTFGQRNGLSFATLDSLAPVSGKPQPSGVALPLAILSGCAMIAVAAFAAVYITRDTGSVQSVALEPAVAAPASTLTAQPNLAPEPVIAIVGKDEAIAEDETAGDEGVPEQAAPTTPTEVLPSLANGRGSTPAQRSPKREPALARAPARVAPPATPSVAPATIETKSADPKPISVEDVLVDAPAAPADTAQPLPSAAAAPADLATPVIAEKAPPKEPRSIDALLDDAVDARPAAPAAAAPTTQDTPSRDQVSTAMRSVEPAVLDCAAQATEPVHGTANVELTIVGATGRVMSVRVTGIQGPVGSCIARAARAASFPQFARDRLTINYPYRLSK